MELQTAWIPFETAMLPLEQLSRENFQPGTMIVTYEKRKKKIQEENVCCYNIVWKYDASLKLHAEMEQTLKIPRESWNA